MQGTGAEPIRRQVQGEGFYGRNNQGIGKYGREAGKLNCMPSSKLSLELGSGMDARRAECYVGRDGALLTGGSWLNAEVELTLLKASDFLRT
jgi:hypothetical protein